MIATRPYNDNDKPLVDALYAEADMGQPSTYDGLIVAEDDADAQPQALAGLVRVEVWNGIAYVNPIIVQKDHQRSGLGTLLMDDVLAHYPEVRLVARGPAVPFYRTLGFQAAAWDDIDTRYSEDCRNCPSLDTCKPQPMRWVAGNAKAPASYDSAK